MSKKIVIVGGGIAAKHSAELLVKQGKGSVEVIVIQANKFLEWPLAMTVVMVKPELHDKVLATDPDVFQVPKVTYKYGKALSVDTAGRAVVIAGGEGVAYDALIIATGFGVPLLYPGIGVSLEQRKAEVKAIGEAIRKASCVVVGGGGVIALEIVGDIRVAYPDKRLVMLCKSTVLSQWPEKQRDKMAAQLKKINVEVISGVSCPKDAKLEAGSIQCDGRDVAFDVYLPAFSQGPNTDFLKGSGVSLDTMGCIVVNEHLQSSSAKEVFAVGVSDARAAFIGMPKLEAQWKDATANAIALVMGKPLKAHKEGMPFMKLPPLVILGHGAKAYGWFDFNNMPPPLKFCCCCGYGGWPCCPPCWPCCCCGGCGACPCGFCCMPPEGSGPAAFSAKMAFMSGGMHFKGLGKPAQQTMK